jgi:hypothetical protein
MCDRTRLAQVLINLCSNAAQVRSITRTHTRTHTNLRTRTHIRTHAHTHTRTHIHMQYTPSGGTVGLRIEAVEEACTQSTVSIRFSVIDNGSGISATEVLLSSYSLSLFLVSLASLFFSLASLTFSLDRSSECSRPSNVTPTCPSTQRELGSAS